MFYYERAGFSALWPTTTAPVHRQCGQHAIGGYPTLVSYSAPAVDFGADGYEFPYGPLKGLGFRFEGNNMNKPVYREHNPNGNDFSNKTGATYAFRISYRY